jgi:hypothetical protein
MKMTDVESSMIHAIGYNPKSRSMDVAFNSGSRYRYFDVPPETYEGLMAAESKGQYMRANVIDAYRYIRLSHR